MLPILFSDTGATSQDGSHSAIFRMQGPEGCDIDKPVYKIFFSTVTFLEFLGQKLLKFKQKNSFSKFDRAPES